MVEALGALIILGALLILVVRYISRKPQAAVVTEEMQVSTEQLKAELARSGDEVIKRMGAHIEHLEGLLRQADDRTSRLETRLAEYERLESRLDSRIEMLEQELATARTVTQELTTARTTMPAMSAMPAMPHATYYQPQAQIPQQPMPSQLPPQSQLMQATPSVPPVEAQPTAQVTSVSTLLDESVPLTTETELERIDGQSFADVLQQSIDRESASLIGTPDAPEQAAGLAEAMRQAELNNPEPLVSAELASSETPIAIEPLTEQLPTEEVASQYPLQSEPIEPPVAADSDTAPVDGDDTAIQAARARAMLRSGYSTEEIARDTGLGRGAIELLRQIIKKEIEG